MEKGPLLTWLVGLLSLAGAMGAELGVAGPVLAPIRYSPGGGSFGPSVAWDHFLAVGVDRRVQVLDVADRTRPRLIGQTQAFGDQVLDVDIDEGILLVAAWRDGLHRCAVSADGRLDLAPP